MNEASGTKPGAKSPGICVIMAGGRGTRFWPLSRADRPKQLLPLASGRSLLRDTFARVEPLVGADHILVVTAGDLGPAVCAELPELAAERIVAEPVGRNTAACAVLGIGLARRIDPQAPVALLPADHFIPDEEIFRDQLRAAFERAAAQAGVVTLGIPPTRPETGYGYIRHGGGGESFLSGVEFVEKPDALRAEGFVRDGRHFWNAGIFVWNPEFFAAETRARIPEICDRIEPAVRVHGTDAFPAALETAYADCPAESLDVAVMEKLAAFEVLPATFRWSDLGSWDAWGELAPELPGGNRGRAEVLALDSTNNVLAVPDRLLALIGVDDMIVVETDDALLVCRKDQAQRIKEVIAALERDARRGLL